MESEDVACGTERFAVACVNEVDEQPVPSHFTYISRSAEQLQLTETNGCTCTGGCTSEAGCPCAVSEQHGRVECGSACSCSRACACRTTQQGLSVPVLLRKGAKGWSVHAAGAVARGKFIACYIGEYLNSREAERRLRWYDVQQRADHALLVIREFLPSGTCLRLNIDGTERGNITRFFNHSCDGGNLALEVVRSRGDLIPRVAFYTARNVQMGEELTFAYGKPSAGEPAADGEALAPPQRCLCGTAACLGYLPRGGR